MSRLLFILASFWPTPDYTGAVAAEAAYVITTYKAPALERCCGACKGGVITHGDGHKTQCPCPDTCKCKAKGCNDKCAPQK